MLAENNLRTEGGKAIAEMLINNRNLYKVDLTNNDIGDGAAPMFCEVIMVCTHFSEEYLRIFHILWLRIHVS